eukprot:358526-Chlamydomonas_euryale.AAC.3
MEWSEMEWSGTRPKKTGMKKKGGVGNQNVAEQHGSGTRELRREEGVVQGQVAESHCEGDQAPTPHTYLPSHRALTRRW